MSELTYEQHTYIARFIHPEKTYPALDEAMIAVVLAIPLETYRQIKEDIVIAVRRTADELLNESGFASRVHRCPFVLGSIVVGLADSITDDWESWLELWHCFLSLDRSNY